MQFELGRLSSGKVIEGTRRPWAEALPQGQFDERVKFTNHMRVAVTAATIPRRAHFQCHGS